MHLREAWRDKKPFGSRVYKPMTVGLGFDYKRKLLENGDTLAWGSTKEQDEFFGVDPQSPISFKERSKFRGLEYYPPDLE